MILVLLLGLLLLPANAEAARTTGWGGENPFVCELRQAGFEATAPGGADADPYCVEFDKRRQNISELGLVQFLAKEPARVAAAVDKCFYFQSDHWRASVVQDDGTGKLYEWDGHYFFDKARGEGGAWVTNFNVNGRSEDPSRYPGIPPEYAQHMGTGTGGVRMTDGSVEPDPRCAERARREPERIYAAAARRAAGVDPAGFATAPGRCRAPGSGRVTRRAVGPVALGATDRQVRAALGPPAEIRRGVMRFCERATLLVVQRGDRSGDLGEDPEAPAVMIVARRGRFRTSGLGPGTRPPRRWVRVGRVGATRLLARSRQSPVVVGVRAGRVRLVAVYDRRAIRTRHGLQLLLARALSG